ncbi:hypothetical protein I5907_08170 [Panacibacter sp. DH6]|uniref:Uncharacterized protein n=1 Tax=Panacibacter microcysteis TaxID=2793269 RepID=A0A931E077_9BACT|nr:hypothetical protein [Panacibacter microcysteis]MBG9376207.1 hypothetical protein [Panacibacter microcysteis]
MATLLPVPHMYVEKYLIEERIAWFIKNKYKPLCKLKNKSERKFIFIEKEHFQNFIFLANTKGGPDGAVRIYFASYPNDNSAPKGFEDLLTLIFVPAEKKGQEHSDLEGQYYDFDPISGHFQKLSYSVASTSVSKFQKNDLKELNKTVDTPEGDTKSIIYTIKKLLELSEEMDYQKASGVKIYFSSYRNIDTDHSRDQYPKQLILQFVLTELIGNSHEDFFIDEREDFPQRERQMKIINNQADLINKEVSKVDSLIKLLGTDSFDTGSPCPPATCGQTKLP